MGRTEPEGAHLMTECAGLPFPMVNGEVQLSVLSNSTVFVHPKQDLHKHGAHGGHEGES